MLNFTSCFLSFPYMLDSQAMNILFKACRGISSVKWKWEGFVWICEDLQILY